MRSASFGSSQGQPYFGWNVVPGYQGVSGALQRANAVTLCRIERLGRAEQSSVALIPISSLVVVVDAGNASLPTPGAQVNIGHSTNDASQTTNFCISSASNEIIRSSSPRPSPRNLHPPPFHPFQTLGPSQANTSSTSKSLLA